MATIDVESAERGADDEIERLSRELHEAGDVQRRMKNVKHHLEILKSYVKPGESIVLDDMTIRRMVNK